MADGYITKIASNAPRPRADDPRFLGSEQDLAPLDRDPVVAFGVV